MTDTYQIDYAREHDLEALREVELACAMVFPESDLPEPFRSTATDRSVLIEAISGGNLLALRTKNGELVGFLLAVLFEGSFHIKEMNVHPSHARKGLGGRLIAQASELALKKGYTHLSLTTFSHLPWNAPFYKKAWLSRGRRK